MNPYSFKDELERDNLPESTAYCQFRLKQGCIDPIYITHLVDKEFNSLEEVLDRQFLYLYNHGGFKNVSYVDTLIFIRDLHKDVDKAFAQYVDDLIQENCNCISPSN